MQFNGNDLMHRNPIQQVYDLRKAVVDMDCL